MCVCVCVCVCAPRYPFQSCSNCEVQRSYSCAWAWAWAWACAVCCVWCVVCARARACVRACVRARARVCVCVSVCVCVCKMHGLCLRHPVAMRTEKVISAECQLVARPNWQGPGRCARPPCSMQRGWTAHVPPTPSGCSRARLTTENMYPVQATHGRRLASEQRRLRLDPLPLAYRRWRMAATPTPSAVICLPMGGRRGRGVK